MEANYYGKLRVPVLGISLEQLILLLYPTFLIPAVYFWYNHLQKRRQAAISVPGCRKLGLKVSSHMIDQYDAKYSEGTDSANWTVKAIHIHPIKSCAAVELDEAEVDAAGMTWDRKFAFAELLPQRSELGSSKETKPKWTFRTQRTPGFEKLALVKPEVWIPTEESKKNTNSASRISQTGALLIKYPHIPTGPLAFLDRFFIKIGFIPSESSFQVPLNPPEHHTYPSETVNIWNDDPTWLNYSTHVPDDFKQYLSPKYPFTLFRVNPTSYREVFRNAPRKETLGYQPTVGFADAYPLHILNLASVHDVGNRIKSSIPNFSALRFRSNILLTGPSAYDEDDWKRIRLISSTGSVSTSTELFCTCHTVRCRLPNVDPDTSERHPVEPDKTLKSFRCIDEGDSKNACLGLQALCKDVKDGATVKVRVGDKVEVVERGQHLYIKQGH